MKTFLIKSFLFTMIFCAGTGATYLLIKARSETKTTTDVEATKLYVSNNETLTAAKRNSLVDKTKWHDMDLNDTNQFDLNCERRRTTDSDEYSRIATCLAPTFIQYRASGTSNRRKILSTNKKKMQYRDSSSYLGTSYNVTKLQYRCP